MPSGSHLLAYIHGDVLEVASLSHRSTGKVSAAGAASSGSRAVYGASKCKRGSSRSDPASRRCYASFELRPQRRRDLDQDPFIQSRGGSEARLVRARVERMGCRSHDRESESRLSRSLPTRDRTESGGASPGLAKPSVNGLGSSKEFVAGLQNDAAQTDRIVFLRRKEIADGLGGGARVVAAERRVHPVFREEDVAGAL